MFYMLRDFSKKFMSTKVEIIINFMIKRKVCLFYFGSGSDFNSWKNDISRYQKAVTFEKDPRCSVIIAGIHKRTFSIISLLSIKKRF